MTSILHEARGRMVRGAGSGGQVSARTSEVQLLADSACRSFFEGAEWSLFDQEPGVVEARSEEGADM